MGRLIIIVAGLLLVGAGVVLLSGGDADVPGAQRVEEGAEASEASELVEPSALGDAGAELMEAGEGSPDANTSRETADEATGDPTGRVAGVVLDANAAAITDVEVRLVHADHPNDFPARPVESDGSFSFEGVAAGPNWSVSASGGDWIQGEQTVEVAAGETVTVELRLDPGAAIAGVVIDGHDRPLSGASVEIWGAPRVTSARDGSFLVRGVRPGVVYLEAKRNGFAMAPPPRPRIDVKAGDRHDGVRLTMHAARPITGRVLDPDGRGIPAAMITCRYTVDNTTHWMGQQEADGRGMFSVTDVPDVGVYSLEAEAVGFRTAELEAVEPGEEVEITLAAAGHIAVRPMDAKTGDPVSATHFVLEEISNWGGGQSNDVESYVATTPGLRASSGVATVPYAGAGRYRVRVEADEYAPGRTEELTLDGDTSVGPLLVAMERGVALRGTVVRANGSPIEGATVRMLAPLGRSSAAGTKVHGVEVRDDFEGSKRERTDAAGRFAFEHLDAGVVHLRVTAEDETSMQTARIVIERNVDPAIQEITLLEGGVAFGRVIGFDGASAADVPIVAHCAVGLFATVRSDQAGDYRIPRLAPGTWAVAPGDPEQGVGGRYHVIMGGQNGPMAPDPSDYEIAIRDGRETRVDIDLRRASGGAVSGRVLVNGAPRGGLAVEVELSEEDPTNDPLAWAFLPNTRTDPDGEYELTGIPPGAYEVRVNDDAGRLLAAETFEVVSGLHHRVDVAFLAATLAGVVVDARTGGAVKNAIVDVSGGGDKGVYTYRDMRTDARGRFEFGLMPVGRYKLVAHSDSGAAAPIEFALSSGEEKDLRVELDPAGSIRVTLTPPGWALSTLAVTLREQESGRVVHVAKRVEAGDLLITGAPPGRYQLEVSQRRLSKRAGGAVEVAADERTELTLELE